MNAKVLELLYHLIHGVPQDKVEGVSTHSSLTTDVGLSHQAPADSQFVEELQFVP